MKVGEAHLRDDEGLKLKHARAEQKRESEKTEKQLYEQGKDAVIGASPSFATLTKCRAGSVDIQLSRVLNQERNILIVPGWAWYHIESSACAMDIRMSKPNSRPIVRPAARSYS